MIALLTYLAFRVTSVAYETAPKCPCAYRVQEDVVVSSAMTVNLNGAWKRFSAQKALIRTLTKDGYQPIIRFAEIADYSHHPASIMRSIRSGLGSYAIFTWAGQ